MNTKPLRRRSRISHFKTPFVISVAGPAVLGIACGGNVLEEDAPSNTGTPTTNPPNCMVGDEGCVTRPDVGVLSTACPSEVPEPGSSCAGYLPGLSCDVPFCYTTQPGRVCGDDGRWIELEMPSCNPPPPEVSPSGCVAEMPAPGSDCYDEGLECRYSGCEGPTSSWARCSYGQWLVQYSSGPACNPPAVIPVCPEVEPVSGAGCAIVSQECGYGSCGENLGPSRSYECTPEGWQLYGACAAVDAGAAPPAP